MDVQLPKFGKVKRSLSFFLSFFFSNLFSNLTIISQISFPNTWNLYGKITIKNTIKCIKNHKNESKNLVFYTL